MNIKPCAWKKESNHLQYDSYFVTTKSNQANHSKLFKYLQEIWSVDFHARYSVLYPVQTTIMPHLNITLFLLRRTVTMTQTYCKL